MRGRPSLRPGSGLAFGVLALGAAACMRSGAGARSGDPIDARGQALELVACQSLIGEEHNQTDITATTLLGLNARKLASRPGQETGVRGHPTDADVVALARQTRPADPESTEIYVGSLGGAFAEVRLTRDGHVDGEPCWTPDGRQVMFASNRGGAFQIWRIDRDGNNLALVTQPVPGADDHGPDARGSRIVFARTATAATGARSTIWMMNADGSGLAQLTTGGGLFAAAAEFVPGDHEPALAPDGSSVVFARRTSSTRATLMRLELATLRLSELAPTTDGEDRLPRFLPGGAGLILARSAPADGLLGRRLVTMTLAGADVVQLTLDARLANYGIDLLAGAGPLPAPVAQAVACDLDDDDANIVLGRRTLGEFDLMRTKDGAGLQIATVAFEGKERAGVFLPFRLALPAATDVARTRLRATFALTVAGAEARVRISVKNYVRNRFDVAWDRPLLDTRFVDATFDFASLAHIDRDGWIRVELAAELPAGERAELALDAVEVEVFARAQ